MTLTKKTISDINRRNNKPGWLIPAAAAAYERAKAAGMPGGSLSDAGRTNAEQWELWWKYKNGELAATAAYPGSDASYHEKGNAVDIAEPARTWLRAHQDYGFVKDTVANEPWHFVYNRNNDKHLNDKEYDVALDLNQVIELKGTGVGKALGPDFEKQGITVGGLLQKLLLSTLEVKELRRDVDRLEQNVAAIRRVQGEAHL